MCLERGNNDQDDYVVLVEAHLIDIINNIIYRINSVIMKSSSACASHAVTNPLPHRHTRINTWLVQYAMDSVDCWVVHFLSFVPFLMLLVIRCDKFVVVFSINFCLYCVCVCVFVPTLRQNCHRAMRWIIFLKNSV